MRKILFLAVSLFALWGCNSSKQADFADGLWLIVGSYSEPADEGVKVYSFSPLQAEAEYVGGLTGIANPSYLTPSPSGTLLYAVGEGENDDSTSTVNALSFNPSSGALSLLDSRRTLGGAPCYVALSPDSRYVLTANYMGASISILSLDSAGRFSSEAHVIPFSGHGPLADRQEQPHLHCVAFAPDSFSTDGSPLLLANDLGLDQIHTFSFHPAAPSLSEVLRPVADIPLAPASGPRHVVFNAEGAAVSRAYLISEISGAVTVFSPEEISSASQRSIDGDYVAGIQSLQADTLSAQGSGDIHLSPDGRYLYASNRLRGDGLAIFRVDPATGLLTRIAYQPTGRHPRNFIIAPDGRHLLVACRDDDTIEIYSRDTDTGLLTDTGRRIDTPKPVCLKFVPRQ